MRLISRLFRALPLSLKATLLTLGVSSVLIACGGSGGVGSGGTGFAGGTQLGSVTGFGSVIVEGNTYSESGTTYLFEKDPSNPSTISSSSVHLGAQTELEFTSQGTTDQADRVKVRPSVIGNLESIAGSRLVVAGQTILIQNGTTLSTVIAGIQSLDQLALGHALEVHGYRNENDELVATRLERLSVDAITETKVIGRVAAVSVSTGSTPAGQIRIGALNIALNASTLVISNSGARSNLSASTLSGLSVGQRVRIYANTAVLAGAVTANVLVLDDLASANDAVVRVGGLVRDFVSASSRFSVGRVLVDASAASYVNGTASDLANGRLVRIKGSVITVNAERVVKANELRFINNEGDRVIELTGTISDYLSKGNFKIRGSLIDASSAGIVLSNGTLNDLDDDVLIRVEGVQRGSSLQVTRLRFEDSTDNRQRAYLGTISNFNQGSNNLTVAGINAVLSPSVQIKARDGGAASAAQLANGLLVKIKGANSGNVFLVTELEIKQDNVAQKVKIQGAANEVNIAAKTFKINGQLVRWDAATEFDFALNLLREGRGLEVEGLLNTSINPAVLQASKIKLKN